MLIVGLLFFIYIFPIGFRPLTITDEARYAEIGREMLSTKDFIVPHLDGFRYFEKPPLGFWSIALSMAIFGINTFAARLPFALSVGASALFLFIIINRHLKDHRKGLFAATSFLILVEVIALGTSCVIDSVLLILLVAVMVFFYFAYREKETKKRIAFLIFAGLFSGMAFLTKGFIAFAVPVVAIVPFLIWEKEWKRIVTLPWIPLVIALIVIIPWAVLIHIKEPDFWHYFFWTSHIERFVGEEGQHPEPLLFYLPILLVGGLPFTVLIPASIIGFWSSPKKDSFCRFMLCWFFFPLLFFSVSSSKLPTYILPCFVPFAFLIVEGLFRYFEKGYKKVFNFTVFIFSAVLSIAGFGFFINQLINPFGYTVYDASETLKWVVFSIVVIMWSATLLFSAKVSHPEKKLALFIMAPIFLMFVSNFLFPNIAKTKSAPGSFLESNTDKITSETILVSHKDLVNLVCWTYKRDDVYLFKVRYFGSVFEQAINFGDDARRVLDIEDLQKLTNKQNNQKPVVLIVENKYYQKYERDLPAPDFLDHFGDFIFAQYYTK